jgi:hypothetical protein
MLRYRDLPTHTNEVLDLTSLTVDEFTALVPAFEAAFLGYLVDWTLCCGLVKTDTLIRVIR